MTNGDRIRSMSNEELAMKWSRLFEGICEMHNNGLETTDCKQTEWVNGMSPCQQCAYKWLKTPVKENRNAKV